MLELTECLSCQQIYELASIAREIASKNPMEEGVLLSLVSCSEELHELLSRNKIPAFTLNTFGRRIEKLLKYVHLC